MTDQDTNAKLHDELRDMGHVHVPPSYNQARELQFCFTNDHPTSRNVSFSVHERVEAHRKFLETAIDNQHAELAKVTEEVQQLEEHLSDVRDHQQYMMERQHAHHSSILLGYL
jgi:hypothetical protein